MSPQKGMSRRQFLHWSMAGSALLAMTACTAVPAGPATGSGEAAEVAAGQKVQLRKMAWGSPLEKEAIEKGLAAFMDQNPEIEVEYIHTPERYPETLQTMLAAGNAPDVYKVGNYYPDIAVRDALMDITDLVSNDPLFGSDDYFFPVEAQRSSVDGKWYAIGSTLQWRLIYYHKPAFESAGITPPSTTPGEAWAWDEFLAAATALTVDANGYHPGDANFDVQNVQQWGFYVPDAHFDNYVYSNGGQLLDDNLQYVLDSPEAIEAIQRFADLRLVNQVAAQGAVLETMGMNAWQMLATGRLAMIQDGNWALLDIAQMDFDFGVGVLPMMQQPATVTGSSWTGIYANTQHPDESWQLLHYLNQDEYQAHLVRVGLWGVSHQTLLSAEGIESWWDDNVHPEGWLTLEEDYKFNYGHVTPNTVGLLETTTMLTQELSQVWTGTMTAEALLTDLVPRLNQTLEEERAEA